VNRAAGLLVALLLGAGPAARAQEVARRSPAARPRLSLMLFPTSGRTPDSVVVRAEHLLEDGVFDGALRNGFPVRYHFTLEMWRKAALFDRLRRHVEWNAVVRLDPLTGEYDLVRSGGTVEHFTSVAAASRALAARYKVDLLPRAGTGAHYYYVAMLDITSLSLTELEEVERWLKGEVGPALEERGNIAEALANGARRLLIRFSGLPRRRLERRSATFNGAR
jgi:hypothetical protein